jgi:hypothetical protein
VADDVEDMFDIPRGQLLQSGLILRFRDTPAGCIAESAFDVAGPSQGHLGEDGKFDIPQIEWNPL